jgi:hypothetical protein
MMTARLRRDAAAFWQLQNTALGFSDTETIKHIRPNAPTAPLNDERRFLEALYLGHCEMEKSSKKEKSLLDQRRHSELDELRAATKVPDFLVRNDPLRDV